MPIHNTAMQKSSAYLLGVTGLYFILHGGYLLYRSEEEPISWIFGNLLAVVGCAAVLLVLAASLQPTEKWRRRAMCSIALLALGSSAWLYVSSWGYDVVFPVLRADGVATGILMLAMTLWLTTGAWKGGVEV